MKNLKGNLLTDIAESISVFRSLRNSRKAGLSVEARVAVQVPLISSGPGLLDTMEGCAIRDWETGRAAMTAYRALPYERKRHLLFPPGPGAYAERAREWKAFLLPVVGPRKCQRAMIDILRWYRQVIQKDLPKKEVKS